jgi:MYXO-CTERM domain-containing protein
MHDDVPPSVSFVTPSDGEFVQGEPVSGKADVRVELAVEDESAIVSVELAIDGNAIGQADTAPPWVFELRLAEGEHQLSAVAIDEADNSGQAAIAIAIGRDEPPASEGSSEDGGDPPDDDDAPSEDESGGDALPSALPASYGMGATPGCSCRSGGGGSPLLLVLLLLFTSRTARVQRRLRLRNPAVRVPP